MRALLAVLILIAGCAAAQAEPWRITKDHWDASDEAGFGAFVTALGDSGCSSSQSCLRDPANPYRATDEHFVETEHRREQAEALREDVRRAQKQAHADRAVTVFLTSTAATPDIMAMTANQYGYQLTEKLEPGMMFRLFPGEKAEFLNPAAGVPDRLMVQPLALIDAPGA